MVPKADLKFWFGLLLVVWIEVSGRLWSMVELDGG